jgi:hypothetical protein
MGSSFTVTEFPQNPALKLLYHRSNLHFHFSPASYTHPFNNLAHPSSKIWGMSTITSIIVYTNFVILENL